MSMTRVIVAGMLTFVSGTASAESLAEKPKVADCNRLATQANVALKSANETSPNYDAAQKQKQIASHYCAVGDFRRGAERYTQVLQLLGVQDQTPKSSSP